MSAICIFKVMRLLLSVNCVNI